MTYYNYYEKMQELSFRACMAFNALQNKRLCDFYSAAETSFYQKLQSVKKEAKETINQSLKNQYEEFKNFVEDIEREASEKILEESARTSMDET